MNKFQFLAAAALLVGAAAGSASAQDTKAEAAASAAVPEPQTLPANPDAAAAEKVDIAVGAEVKSADGVNVGTVKALDATGNVVIDDKGKAFALSKDLFTPGATGGLALKVTAKQLADARAGAQVAPGRN